MGVVDGLKDGSDHQLYCIDNVGAEVYPKATVEALRTTLKIPANKEQAGFLLVQDKNEVDHQGQPKSQLNAIYRSVFCLFPHVLSDQLVELS